MPPQSPVCGLLVVSEPLPRPRRPSPRTVRRVLGAQNTNLGATRSRLTGRCSAVAGQAVAPSVGQGQCLCWGGPASVASLSPGRHGWRLLGGEKARCGVFPILTGCWEKNVRIRDGLWLSRAGGRGNLRCEDAGRSRGHLQAMEEGVPVWGGCLALLWLGETGLGSSVWRLVGLSPGPAAQRGLELGGT